MTPRPYPNKKRSCVCKIPSIKKPCMKNIVLNHCKVLHCVATWVCCDKFCLTFGCGLWHCASWSSIVFPIQIVKIPIASCRDQTTESCSVCPHVLCDRQVSKCEFCIRNAMWTVRNSHFRFMPVATIHLL